MQEVFAKIHFIHLLRIYDLVQVKEKMESKMEMGVKIYQKIIQEIILINKWKHFQNNITGREIFTSCSAWIFVIFTGILEQITVTGFLLSFSVEDVAKIKRKFFLREYTFLDIWPYFHIWCIFSNRWQTAIFVRKEMLPTKIASWSNIKSDIYKIRSHKKINVY